MKYQDKTNHLSLITQTANLPNKKKMREGFFLNTTYNTTYQKLLIENPIIKLHQFIKVDELQQLKLRKYKSLTPDKELIFGYLSILFLIIKHISYLIRINVTLIRYSESQGFFKDYEY
ncbi:unnamed protein product [Paramecium sonneborni]|uniref:Transmembrane protein n=1 Tax=Paramecium sonneborni TaxID=65129 RepID=A0A8S1N8Q5_9CILI|nr:unnamed protein product [Paramecium sonneborni]